MGVLHPMLFEGWMRAIPQDVAETFRLTKVEHVNKMIKHKFRGKIDEELILKDVRESIEIARSHEVEMIGVNAEDASRTGMDYLLKFAKNARDSGTDRLRYCDTLGYDDPFTMLRPG